MPRQSNLKPSERAAELPDSALVFAELDGLLGYLLRRAQGAMHRDFMASVASFELTQKQAATMWLIQANAGVSQAEVATALGMDRATMMALTDRLEDRGFVVRKRSSTDRRRQDLYLTPSGHGVLRKCKTRITEHEDRFRSMFSAAEYESLLDSLKRFQNFD